LEPAAALALLDAPAQPIDLGQVGDQLFLNMATGGFGSQVTANTSEDLKCWGRRHMFTGLSRFSELQAASVDLQGRFRVAGRAAGAGHRQRAPGRWRARAVSGRQADDGLLDIGILPAPQEWWGLCAGCWQGQAVRPGAAAMGRNQERPGLDINLDGEPLQADSLRFEAVPWALRLHLPADSPLLSRPG
jgi:diacylglycerol kinase family enzyme